MKVRGRFEWRNGLPLVRAAVVEIASEAGQRIATWSNGLPPEVAGTGAKTLTAPWIRLDGDFPPRGGPESIKSLLNGHRELLGERPVDLSLTHALSGCCIVYETELAHGRRGMGWAFPVLCGTNTRVRRRSENKPAEIRFVRVLRAGADDLGSRVPAVQALRTKTVAVFGLGAVGAPLAVQLAKNGCRRLHLLDNDIVEPGNSIRWPLGSTAWGLKKTAALKEWIEREYPWAEVIPHDHQIGVDPGTGALLKSVFAEIDVAVDAAASHGVTALLGDYARELARPMVSLFASPNVEGGVVACFGTAGGCPSCLEHAWAAGRLPKPRGLGTDNGLQQPPGCSERTFTGASFDLQKITLQAVRSTIEILRDPEKSQSSRIFTLALADDQGAIPPCWSTALLQRQEKCECSRVP